MIYKIENYEILTSQVPLNVEIILADDSVIKGRISRQSISRRGINISIMDTTIDGYYRVVVQKDKTLVSCWTGDKFKVIKIDKSYGD